VVPHADGRRLSRRTAGRGTCAANAQRQAHHLVNILAGREVVPEFLKFDDDARPVAAAALRLLSDPAAWTACRDALNQVMESLGPPGTTRARQTRYSILWSAGAVNVHFARAAWPMLVVDYGFQRNHHILV